MKHLILLLLFSFLAVLVSCGDNTTTPVESTVLFTLDTLSASIDAGVTGLDTASQIYSQSILASQVKIEFHLQSNVDSTFGSYASYLDSTNGTPLPPSPMTINVYAPVDTSYSFTYNVAAQPLYAGFMLSVTASQPQTETKYIRMTNIKVTKVQ